MRLMMRSAAEAARSLWVKKGDYCIRSVRQETTHDVEEFARNYYCKGEKVVSLMMQSRKRDQFCGQWLVANVPFKDMRNFQLSDELDAKIPLEHKYFAMVLKCQHEVARRTWCQPHAIKEEMKMEAHSEKMIASTIKMYQSWESLVSDYENDRISVLQPKASEAAAAAALAAENACSSGAKGQRSWDHNLRIQPQWEDLIRSGDKTVEGRVNEGVATTIKKGSVLLLGKTLVKVTNVNRYSDFEAMLRDVGVQNALPNVKNLAAGVRVYHGFKNYEKKARQFGVLCFSLQLIDNVCDKSSGPKMNAEQERFYDGVMEAVSTAVDFQNCTNERDLDELRAQALRDNRAMICFGPPGTGKSFAMHCCIEETLAKGGKVLLTTPTAQLISSMRARYGDRIDLDTCHAAYLCFVYTFQCSEYYIAQVSAASRRDAALYS